MNILLQTLARTALWLCLAAFCGYLLHGVLGASIAIACLALFLLLMQYIQAARMLRWALHLPVGVLVAPQASGLWGAIYRTLEGRSRNLGQQRSDLETELTRFRQATEAMPDGVLILDGHRAIEWINNQGQILLNLSASSDRGLPITHLLREPEFHDFLAQRRDGSAFVLRSQRTPGRLLEIQIVPFSAGRSVMLVRDITQIHKLEVMRRDFVANVSHELRTPLTVVTGFLETLQEHRGTLSPEEEAHCLTRAAEQSRRMQNLLQDLLTLAALETDQPPPSEAVPVRALLQQVHDEIAPLASPAHTLQITCHDDPVLLGHPGELHSALSNLAINALRYSPQGGAIILGWAQDKGQDGVLSVRDQGIGIAAEHVPRLTERFYRVDQGRSRASGGTGLGLAIVKHVLERHQARLAITSTPGAGSCFSMIFPALRVRPRLIARCSGSDPVRQ